jgi:hypothetical protein
MLVGSDLAQIPADLCHIGAMGIVEILTKTTVLDLRMILPYGIKDLFFVGQGSKTVGYAFIRHDAVKQARVDVKHPIALRQIINETARRK